MHRQLLHRLAAGATYKGRTATSAAAARFYYTPEATAFYDTPEVIAHRIAAVLAQQIVGLEDVAERLAHLQAVLRQKAVRVYQARQRHVCRHKHCRPVHSVEPQDILAYDVHVNGPTVFQGVLQRGLLQLLHQRRDVASVCARKLLVYAPVSY